MTLVEQDMAEQPDVIVRALERNADALERARARIAEAAFVRLVGIGSSRHAAGYGATALENLRGVPASVAAAPGEAVGMGALVPGHVAIVVSQSGRTPALVRAAHTLKDAGATIVSVTNDPSSELDELADVPLRCDAGAERVVAATKSVVAQCVLLRALAAPFDPSALGAATAATLEDGDLAARATGDAPDTVVASGFAAEWVSAEIALKFAEMAGRPAAGESLVEFLHGPVAAARRVVAFVRPDDPNAQALPAAVRIVPPLPSPGDDTLDAIVTLVAGQVIAHAWSLALGEDPDAPRGLSKVTPTR
jgi:glucosamine--fructose-6-phosphate aminotransferase (isomerizing)